MSYRVRRSRLEPGPRFRLGEEFYKKIVEGQPNDILLFLQEEHFKGLLSGFNRSSLRKVHSVVTETLQEVLRGFSQVTERPELKRNLELLATRTKIILQYQSNRIWCILQEQLAHRIGSRLHLDNPLELKIRSPRSL